MGVNVDVILTKDIRSLGKLGEKRAVRLGYARNYLLPRGFALLLSENNLKRFEGIKKKELAKREKEKVEFEAILVKINGKTIEFEEKVHDEIKLYGSVTPSDVLKKVEQELKVKLDRGQIEMPEHIRQIGSYEVTLYLYPDVEGSFKLIIKGIDEEETREVKKEKKERKPKATKVESEEDTDHDGEKEVKKESKPRKKKELA